MSGSNSQVVRAFLKQQSAKTQHLHSDGGSLWSYGWWEMARWVDGELIVRKGCAYSPSTGQHMGLIRGHGRLTWRPVEKTQPTLNGYLDPIGAHSEEEKLRLAADDYVLFPTGKIRDQAWLWGLDYDLLRETIKVRAKVLKAIKRLKGLPA